MRGSALILKLDFENRLSSKPTPEKWSSEYTLLLNEKQTDESYQIFIPFNNINISPVSCFFGGKLENEALSLAAFRILDVVV